MRILSAVIKKKGKMQNRESLELFLKPWFESLKNPAQSQESTLRRLLNFYQQTDYGSERSEISTIEKFRGSFPIVTFEDVMPYIEKVKRF